MISLPRPDPHYNETNEAQTRGIIERAVGPLVQRMQGFLPAVLPQTIADAIAGMDAGQQAQVRANIGAGTVGSSVFLASSAGQFLIRGGVGFYVPALADDAAVSFNVGVANLGGLLGYIRNTNVQCGWAACRVSASPFTPSLIGNSSGTVNFYNTALGGTTGADNSLNFGVDSSGNIWGENRTGAAINLQMVYLRPGV